MREIATIIPDKEFNDYLGWMKEQLAGGNRSSRVNFIVEALTVSAGQKDERVYTESQLKQIFNLTNERALDQNND